METADRIQEVQQLMQDDLYKRMTFFENQLAALKEPCQTVKLEALAKDFFEFKAFAVEMMSSLRQQILDMQFSIDRLETRSRSDCLIFKGFPEQSGEDTFQVVGEVLRNKLGISDVSIHSFRACYRLGSYKNSVTRAIVVRFSDYNLRHTVWTNKTKFKGTPYSCSEFLTRTRQVLFVEARKIFGINNCWTQDGTIVVKLSDGSKQKLVKQSDLESLSLRKPVTNVQTPEAQNQTKGRPKRVVKR